MGLKKVGDQKDALLIARNKKVDEYEQVWLLVLEKVHKCGLMFVVVEKNSGGATERFWAGADRAALMDKC